MVGCVETISVVDVERWIWVSENIQEKKIVALQFLEYCKTSNGKINEKMYAQ